MMPPTSTMPDVADGPGRDDADQDDGGGVVEPRLRLERAGQPLGQRQRAEHREHRGRVRRRADGAEQDRQLPRQAEEVVGADRDDRDGHRHAEGRQRQPQPDARAHLPPVGGETTLGQDDRQRAEAQRVRELRVVERDRERSALAEQDADEQVDEQRRAARRPPRPAPRGSPPASRPRRPARTRRAGGRRMSWSPRAIG